ncbi:MAG TPA: hypothetical protein VGC57_06080 [Cellulomonas sp.]
MPETSPHGDPPDLPEDVRTLLADRVDLTGTRPLTVVVDAGSALLVPGLDDAPATRVLLADRDGEGGPAEALPDADRVAEVTLADRLRTLRHAVLAAGADLGLVLDADGARLAVLDENGERVDPSVVAALVALREVARERATGATPVLVQDVLVSRTLPDLLASARTRVELAATGLDSLTRTVDAAGAVLAVGHDGLVVLPASAGPVGRPGTPGAAGLGGLLAARHVVAALGGQPHPLSVLAELHQSSVTSGAIDSQVTDPDAARERVVEAYVERQGGGVVEVDETDGLTVSHWGEVPPWWFHLRTSSTEHLVRLHVEAADEDIMEKVRDDVLALVRQED